MAERVRVRSRSGDYILEIDGRKELVRALRAADSQLPKKVREANKTAAQVVADRATPKAPVGKTGRLRKSIKTLASQRYASVKAGTAARVPYAPPIHWGWPARNIAPNPFLNDAKNEALRDGSIEEAYEREIEQVLRLVNSGRRIF